MFFLYFECLFRQKKTISMKLEIKKNRTKKSATTLLIARILFHQYKKRLS